MKTLKDMTLLLAASFLMPLALIAGVLLSMLVEGKL